MAEETQKLENLDQRTRRQIVKEANEKRAKEAARVNETLKAAYAQIADSAALADLLSKGRSLIAYHAKMAEDGVGVRVVGRNEAGNDITEEYVLTPEQRVSELDQAKGLRQLVAYVERRLSL